MTPVARRLVVLALTAGLGWPAVVMATPQGDTRLHHDHGNTAPTQSAAPNEGRHDMMARMAALDERIKTLTADMNMFVGDMKVQTMAKLLTALVERQTMMRDEMMSMRDGMMKMGSMMNMESMNHGRSMMQENATPAPHDEPGMMCAPE